MAASLPGFGGIASRLVHEGLISEASMQKVLAESQQQKTNLIAYVAVSYTHLTLPTILRV